MSSEKDIRFSAVKMADSRIDMYEESLGSNLAKKAQQSPALIIGLVGLVATCAIGAYKYKHRGAMSTSVFLMQLRVAAQGVAIGSLTIGMTYSMINDYVLHRKKE
ncbi:HIG1 domain family member 1A, mitochondrial-like [Neodiprion virginianus]|uniref:HIG1 domain family member 1A, mitochondrial-like n=1 Tax=Neodiprion fabricii TaxID=2872261 RepID=UPI001ED90E9E|nr:HIG1 domain family member 1A, mitochondrial-like [Neodiprion fabricii]XP_046605684.1 HIG1 domain family member 1A, mitochondrial-like [Neodiprion virginianus]